MTIIRLNIELIFFVMMNRYIYLGILNLKNENSLEIKNWKFKNLIKISITL
jgi:hypothetical protein